MQLPSVSEDIFSLFRVRKQSVIYFNSTKQFFNGEFIAESVLKAECQLTDGSVESRSGMI